MRGLLLIIAAFFSVTIISCITDDITDSPDATLSFSTDTLSFGTVFTELTTPTARLQVFNRNSKGVNISSIRFRDPDSPFSLNVDGVSGTSFSDVEIRARDSIYIFVECFINEDESPDLKLVTDQLEFVTNGVTQTVTVEAYGWNVIRLKGEILDEDLTMTAEKPYIIFDSLVVAENATLNIEPGAKVLFHDDAFMKIEGTLNAVGSPDAFIDMTGDRLDDVLPDVGYEILAGQWRGIDIMETSYNNRMEYVNMRSTSQGLYVDSCATSQRQKLTLVNSWLHNSQTTVLDSRYAKVDAYGCCFSEAGMAVVRLVGGNHQFVQCTIANSYLFTFFGEPNLTLYYCMPEDGDNGKPLMRATFDNMIIWGDVGSPIYPGILDGSSVYIRNVLLKADGTDDEHFIDCIWNEDPLFYTIRSDYYFNYRLKPDSPAIGRGNPAYLTPQCMYDMDGYFRMADGAPALGAYVFVPPAEEESY